MHFILILTYSFKIIDDEKMFGIIANIHTPSFNKFMDSL